MNESQQKPRNVFFLSDRTGITAELLGQSLLAQFETISFNTHTIPYLDSNEKAHEAVQRINQSNNDGNQQPLVFSTIVQPEIQTILHTSRAVIIDIFESFIAPLEEALGTHSSQRIGKKLSNSNKEAYDNRMHAVNFALNTDDGMSTNIYDNAEIILIGVSRCGKTPTALYLAMQFGILAANYPFVEDDLETPRLPEKMQKYRDKVFGLVITPQRLHEIRTLRRPNSKYASLEQCESETRKMDLIYRRENIPAIDTTSRSVEEIATQIIHKAGLRRAQYG
jgi:regulator of PEP synthase PpsR (kinase-PPPase family)